MPIALPIRQRLLDEIERKGGQTDRELANNLLGRDAPQQAVNPAARALAQAGRIVRRTRPDGLIGNYSAAAPPAALAPAAPQPPTLPGPVAEQRKATPVAASNSWPTEDHFKATLKEWLERDGWRVTVMWGKDRGVDVEAFRDQQRWLFEVKGAVAAQPQNASYFLGALAETLQRMSDPNARYTIVFPDTPQYRGLWKRLPALAKERTQVSAIFVSAEGHVESSAH